MNVITDHMAAGMVIDVTQAASGVAGIVHLAKMQPYIAPTIPLRNSVLGDFTVSPDANLVPVTITWGGPYTEPAGGVSFNGAGQLFQLADVADACSCYGMLILNAAGDTLLYAEQFATPIALRTILDGFVYAPGLTFGTNSVGGGTVIH